MKENTASEKKNQIMTIPNLLSVCRILMIPVFIWAYCVRKEYSMAFWLLLLFGVTDLVDGFIARTFHMVSDLGKALDPIADKLTQGAVLLCLGTRFPLMFLLAGLLVIKGTTTGLMSLWAIRKTKEVKSANWHGKITTCLLYFTMLLHIFWLLKHKMVGAAFDGIPHILHVAGLQLTAGRTGPWGVLLLPWAVFGAAPHSYLKYRSILARGGGGLHLHFSENERNRCYFCIMPSGYINSSRIGI